jgi:hypothetical protein
MLTSAADALVWINWPVASQYIRISEPLEEKNVAERPSQSSESAWNVHPSHPGFT